MSSPIALRDYSRMSGDDALPPPPPASWTDYFWWIVLALLGLIALGTIAAVVLAGVYGSTTLHKLDTWPSPSSAATAMPSPTAAATIPPTPTSAATRYPSFSSFPTPSPVCACCAQCSSADAYQCTCCQYCPSCDGQVSMPLVSTALNINGRVGAGGAIPPDTILAVGNNDDEGRIITVVNNVVTILNKATHKIISADRFFFFGGATSKDGYVSWDPYSERFFATTFNIIACGRGVDVLAPPAIAGIKCSAGAQFGSQSFLLTGTLAAASSITACVPVASLAGKIAFVQRGGCPHVVKAKNVQNAGAIAMLEYNNIPGGDPLPMGGVDPTVVIPVLMVSNADGLAIAANLPATVTLTSSGGTSFSTEMFISVSNTSAPNDRNDFYHYQVVDGNYSDTYADFPKHVAGPETFYISTQTLGTQENNFVPCLGAEIRAFDKTALLEGIGAITLWEFIAPGAGVDAPQFLAPARVNAPIANERLHDIFIGINNGNTIGFCDWNTKTPATGFSVYGASADGIDSFVGYVPFPTPMSFGACVDSLCNRVFGGARQPPPPIPYEISLITVFPTVGVIRNNKLHTAIVHNISSVQYVVRWFIIDVEPMTESKNPILLQWGDLNISPDIDTFYPAIDVAADGSMAISFYQSGPEQPVVASYTAHIVGDEPNSIRTPFHVAIPNVYTYFEDYGSGINRYGDYTGLQVDPVDKHTFYASVQRPDSIGFFFPPGTYGCDNASTCVSRDWVTDLFSFRLTTNACPTDGFKTTATVLPSFGLPDGLPSTGATNDPSEFEVPPHFNRPEEGEEWEMEFAELE